VQEQQPVFQYAAPETTNQIAELFSVNSRARFKDVKTQGGWLKDSNSVNRYKPIAKTPYEVASLLCHILSRRFPEELHDKTYSAFFACSLYMFGS